MKFNRAGAIGRNRAAAGQQYAIIVGLIAVVAIIAITRLGGGVGLLMTKVANSLANQGAGGAAGAGSGTAAPPPTDLTLAYVSGTPLGQANVAASGTPFGSYAFTGAATVLRIHNGTGQTVEANLGSTGGIFNIDYGSYDFCNYNIPAGGDCDVPVFFGADRNGPIAVTITATVTDPIAYTSNSLSATGTASGFGNPDFTLAPAPGYSASNVNVSAPGGSYSFPVLGDVTHIRLTNTGTVPLVVNTFGLNTNSDYIQPASPACPNPLTVGAFCEVYIQARTTVKVDGPMTAALPTSVQRQGGGSATGIGTPFFVTGSQIGFVTGSDTLKLVPMVYGADISTAKDDSICGAGWRIYHKGEITDISAIRAQLGSSNYGSGLLVQDNGGNNYTDSIYQYACYVNSTAYYGTTNASCADTTAPFATSSAPNSSRGNNNGNAKVLCIKQ